MARLRDLKDKLKGQQKRLERAEALLERVNELVRGDGVQSINGELYFNGLLCLTLDKIKDFLNEPIDTSE